MRSGISRSCAAGSRSTPRCSPTPRPTPRAPLSAGSTPASQPPAPSCSSRCGRRAYAKLHRALHDAAIEPPLTAAADALAIKALPAAVRPTWRRLRRTVDDLAVVPSDAALHEVRIRAKRLRYAAELAAPVIGRPARDLAAAAARVQDVLGDHQDSVVADAWLAKTAPECSSAEAYALGMLAEIERGFAVRRAIRAAPGVERGAGAVTAGLAVSEPDVVHAAGGVITRAVPGGFEVLVVHRPRYDDWSLPKGKSEPGETDEETARREVEEETGLRCTLGDELPTVRYRDRKGRDKQVRYWFMTVVPDPRRPPGGEPSFEPNDEVDECRWISPVGAATLLSYEADRTLMRSLGGTDGPAAPR